MNMNRFIAGIVLFFLASTSQADIWTSLFREKLQEAENGSSEAQYDVGTMYQNGRGVAADRDKAIEWFRKAAAQNDSKAVSRLNLMEANAARFDKTAGQAAKGDRDSLYDLGNMYMKGVGTNINYKEAIIAFEQAAGHGHVKAAYKLGLIYNEGTGFARNGKQAFKWFRISAENGFPAAQYYLGKLYADGNDVNQDLGEALVWLGKAVDGGFDQARGTMIDVSERISMADATPAEPKEPEPQKTVASPALAKPAKTASSSKTAVRQPDTHRKFSLEDILHATWHREGESIGWMPSGINKCKKESGKITCFTDDQMRKSGANIIKYKIKSIISDFTDKGTFEVKYRNLVIGASPAEEATSDPAGSSEVGGLDEDTQVAYQVKTGWGKTHTLECSMQTDKTISCMKDSAHAIVLTSATSVAGK